MTDPDPLPYWILALEAAGNNPMEAQRMTGGRSEELEPLWFERWLCARKAYGDSLEKAYGKNKPGNHHIGGR